ncbi:unnamed protein product, partial [Didymodactylos carnosus]
MFQMAHYMFLCSSKHLEYALELQHLRNDERAGERDLLRLNLDMYKIAINPRR